MGLDNYFKADTEVNTKDIILCGGLFSVEDYAQTQVVAVFEARSIMTLSRILQECPCTQT